MLHDVHLLVDKAFMEMMIRILLGRVRMPHGVRCQHVKSIHGDDDTPSPQPPQLDIMNFCNERRLKGVKVLLNI